MVESADFGKRYDLAESRRLHLSGLRRILAESKVRPGNVIQAHEETPMVPKLSFRTGGTRGTEEQPGSCVRRRRDLRPFSM